MRRRGCVIWLTGLPAAGKTTLAKALGKELESMGYDVEILDGDEVRRWLSPEAGFTREDRERHLKRVIYVSKLLAKHGVFVIAAFVSPYRRIREFAREVIGDFIEVYVKCSLETVIKRDPKGLYKKALRGEIKNMTGIDDPYEEPLNPDVIVNTEKESPQDGAKKIIKKLREYGYIQ